MDKERIKSPEESEPNTPNSIWNISTEGSFFGGKLVEWMEVVAAVVARHSECEVTTACINKWTACPLNSMIHSHYRIDFVGNTSMNVQTAYVENWEGRR